MQLVLGVMQELVSPPSTEVRISRDWRLPFIEALRYAIELLQVKVRKPCSRGDSWDEDVSLLL